MAETKETAPKAPKAPKAGGGGKGGKDKGGAAFATEAAGFPGSRSTTRRWSGRT